MSGAETSRRDELAAALAEVRRRITAACAAAGRDEGDVTLVVVTKFFPASDVRLLHGLGVREVGENRHQEAQEKAAELADLDLVWHFIGGLQSNKATAVASYADVVESLDRTKLLAGLARGAGERAPGHVLDVLVQVSLDEVVGGSGGSRAGVPPDEVAALAGQVADHEGLRLRGVMAVAPPQEDPATVFARLAEVAARVRAVDPAATWISAGMSGDLEPAIGCGATHVRVGSAVLGRRPSIQ